MGNPFQGKRRGDGGNDPGQQRPADPAMGQDPDGGATDGGEESKPAEKPAEKSGDKPAPKKPTKKK